MQNLSTHLYHYHLLAYHYYYISSEVKFGTHTHSLTRMQSTRARAGFVATIQSTLKNDTKDLASSTLLACISGIVAAVIHFSSNDREIKQYYALNCKPAYSLYVACIFIIWMSFVVNARHVVVNFFTLCLTRIGPLS